MQVHLDISSSFPQFFLDCTDFHLLLLLISNKFEDEIYSKLGHNIVELNPEFYQTAASV